MRWELRIVAIVTGFVVAQRAAKLHFAETKTVAETVRGAGQFFQLGAAFGIQQIELFVPVCQPAEADSEEADFSLLVAMNSKKFLKHGKNVRIKPRRFAQGFGTCVGVKASVANGQRERARGETGFAQSFAGFLREMAEHGGQSVHVVGVFAKRVIVRDRFWLGVNDKLVGIAAARLAVQRRSPLAENAFQFFLRHGRNLFDGFDAEGAKRAFRNFADAGNFSHWQLCKKALLAACGNPHKAARLGLIRSDLGNEARRSEPAGTGQRSIARDLPQQVVRGGERRSVQSFGTGEIEVGFVNRNHFNDRRKLREDGRDAVAPLSVFFVMAVQENSVRAKPSRSAQRHRGMNAVFPRFIARRGNYAALVRPPAHDYRLATKLRAIEQFHGDEKRVHVDVKD